MTRICVIGNFSGRNAGDVAILGGVLKDISDRYSGCIFIVPTINPQFIKRTFPEYDIEAVGLLPWNLSIKIFGWPILCSVLSADLVLITDAILFDYKLMNPLYNYLSTMAIVLPLARRKRIPVVLYNVSLGPIYSRLGKICMRRVLESSKQILVRDNESLKMLKALDLTGYSDRIIESADSALNAIPSDTGRLNEMIRKEDILTGERSWVSVNISSYIDVYVRNYKRKGIGREKFLNMMAKVIDRIVSELMVNVVLVITQPMDLTIAGQLLNKLKDHSFIRMISNKDYSYQDLTAVFMSVEMHIGMRTHSLILASSVLTPIVGIIATPKNRGYMSSIEQENRMVEFKDISAERLFNVAKTTWENREKIKEQLSPIIERQKKKASGAADHLKEYIN